MSESFLVFKSLEDEIIAKILCLERAATSQGHSQWIKPEMNLAKEAGGVHLYPLGCSPWVFSDVKEEIHGLLQISPVFQWKQEYCLWKHFLTWKNSHDLQDPSSSRPSPGLSWWNCDHDVGTQQRSYIQKLGLDSWLWCRIALCLRQGPPLLWASVSWPTRTNKNAS